MKYREHHLDQHARPKYIYEYFVTGSGTFPFDMLRHDHCWPYSGEEAAKLDTSFGDRERRARRSVAMRSYSAPTTGRWSSFGWIVSDHKTD